AAVALRNGNAEGHDNLIAGAAAKLTDCDVLVLGQFSMASATRLIPALAGRTVLTSPDSAVMRLKQALHA
ncbi:MAG: arylsulfatase, partial [Betaproteobacteria bacterium]|nr:arylsulfatase [Betaproteobacteria bacterium]